MYKKMTEELNVLAGSNNEGLKWVKERNYAYFMESTSIQYITERDCDVAQVGELLDTKGYGIAMRKSVYHWLSDLYLLRLQSNINFFTFYFINPFSPPMPTTELY
jgi:ionotropic kainate glutamate receptor 2